MNNIETNPVFNPQARETRGGGYKALEAEAIEASILRYKLEKEQEERMEEAGYDPRVLAAQAEMAYRGFNMNMGQEYQISENA